MTASTFRADVLSNKRILITGGGTGLGKELARHFVAHGASVHICGRREAVSRTTRRNRLKVSPTGTIRSPRVPLRISSIKLFM